MDLYFFQQINNLAGEFFWLDVLGIFLAKYLGYVLAVLVFLILWKRWKTIFQVFLAATLAKFGVVELIRWLWARPRPFVENQVNLLLDHVSTPAFPSGHAAFFFALSTVIFLYNKKAGLLFFAVSILISLARVFVGLHWPSDIITGAAVGIFSGWLVVRIFRKF